MSFSEDNRFIVIREGETGLLRADGTLVWVAGNEAMSAARDLQTFVAWWEPSHGPGDGRVSSLDAAGKVLWTSNTSVAGAVISPAGDKIVARLNIDQSPREADDNDPRETSLQVLSRDGSVRKTLPADGIPVSISPDGNRVILRTESALQAIRLDGTRLFEISLVLTFSPTHSLRKMPVSLLPSALSSNRSSSGTNHTEISLRMARH